MSDIAYIMRTLPNELDFQRMGNYDNISFTYDEFLKHNKKIICELPGDDLAFLRRLCGIITTTGINLMDMESCVEFRAGGIYYNMKGKLCIFNPR